MLSQVHSQAPQNSDRGTIESSSLTILLHFDRAPDLKKINSKTGFGWLSSKSRKPKGKGAKNTQRNRGAAQTTLFGKQKPRKVAIYTMEHS